MASFNKVIILGNCGRDPEVRYLPSGQAVANVSVATSYKSKGRDGDGGEEIVEWHRVTFFDRLAEIAGEYLKKGHPVLVEGRLKYGKFTDKEGVERSYADIVATSMQLLGRREDGDDQGRNTGGGQRPSAGGGGYERSPGQRARQEQGQRQQPQQRPASQSSTGGGSTGFDDFDDDIPF